MTPESLSADVLDILTDPTTPPELHRKLTYTADQLAKFADGSRSGEPHEDDAESVKSNRMADIRLLTKTQQDLIREARRKP